MTKRKALLTRWSSNS